MEEWLAMAADKPRPLLQNSLVIRTTVIFLLVMVLIFSQNYTSNDPYSEVSIKLV